MFKNKSLKKFIAVFLLVVFVNNAFLPTVSFALTSLYQPEYSAYESNSATDMVNLVTGDFTYTMPIVEVPGPEGSFSLPLSYHAGIETEQDASWVGLGWSLNAGAIQRNASQYPDDFNGQQITTTINDAGGSGHSINYIVGNYSSDTRKGTGGSIGLGSLFSVGWGTQEGLTAIGITANNKGISVDGVGVATSLITIATAGIGSGGSSILSSTFGSAGESVGVALSTASSLYSYANLAAGLASVGSKTANINDWKVDKTNYILYQSYKYSLDVTKGETTYGALNLQNTVSPGLEERAISPYVFLGSSGTPNNRMYQYKAWVASDMHVKDNGAYSFNPSSVAYDNYNVMGEGIAGSIKPYRLDMGSLAYPTMGSNNYSKYAMVQFLNSKVQFRFDGELANSYTHHLGSGGAPGAGAYGIECSFVHHQTGQPYLNFIVKDPTLYNSSQRTEPDRPTGGGLKNSRLAGNNHIEWFTNDEIESTAPTSAISTGKFIDFKSGQDRQTFRNARSGDGIGGFSITRGDGLTYHYALPVYNQQDLTKSWQFNTPNNFNETRNLNPYAIDWLLTAITGPDFVDRGTVGVVDDLDYGYWVKFDYGKFSKLFHWRTPYSGAGPFNIQTYSEGIKETYYLNSISTRTHTALFIKSLRTDGKGAYTYDQNNCYSNAFSQWVCDPSSSLKLDEIVLLTNEDYNKLITPTASGGIGLNYASNNGINYLRNSDSFNGDEGEGLKILDNWDLNESMINFIAANQIKKTKFNYYSPGDAKELCKKTLNSFDISSTGVSPRNDTERYNAAKGKLTLKSVSFLGRENSSVLPDYLFEYANNNNRNPVYETNLTDAWGMNKPGATGYRTATGDGVEWSLTKITTPTGAEIEVQYERDTYSSISGIPLDDNVKLVYNAAQNSIAGKEYKNSDPYDFNKYTKLKAGDMLNITGTITTVTNVGTCSVSTTPINMNAKISSIVNDVIFLDPTTNIGTAYSLDPSPSCNVNYTKKGITALECIPYGQSKLGGDIRVSSISTKDENGKGKKISYIYTEDGTTAGLSSGVCSIEPEIIRQKSYYFYDYYDYPNTGVMYKKVTVLDGKIGSSEYLTRTEYEFVTPNQYMVQMTTAYYYPNQGSVCDASGSCNALMKMSNQNLKILSASIGRINSVRQYNYVGHLLSSMNYNYKTASDFNNIGLFTQGSFLTELVYNNDNYKYYKVQRTSKTYYPDILASVTTMNDGITRTVSNTKYDFLTGNILETEYENSYGQKYKTKSVPAYTLTPYAAMGSKVENSSNKNMLNQEAANYLYSLEGATEKLISANVQTWNNKWKYKDLVSASNTVEDVEIIDVWRKYQTYTWKSLLNSDGTIAGTFQDFWSNPTNTAWQKTSEATRYDHYSKAIESKDINENYRATKLYKNKFPVASGVNTNYASFTYTGFEESTPIGSNYYSTDVLYYGYNIWLSSGVDIQNGTLIKAHTGNSLVKLSPNTYGPIFTTKQQANDVSATGNIVVRGLQVGRKYVGKVWVHKDSPADAKIVADLNGSVNASVSVRKDNVNNKQVGDWILMSVIIDVPKTYVSAGGTNNDLRIYIQNPNATQPAYFDDFMVRPFDAAVSGSVYDDKTGLVTATIDNENYATKFNYDKNGRLLSKYIETPVGFKLANRYSYNMGRQ